MINRYTGIISFCFFAFFLFASCAGKSAISKKLSGADSLVITFNKPDSDSVLNTVITTESKAISKLTGFIDGKGTEQKKCACNGNMIFYSKGEVLLPVIFQYNEDSCHHFLFEMENKVIATLMSNEAVDFLKSLSSGKSWY
jgi:hypothetical protein